MTSLHLFNMDRMKSDFQEVLQLHVDIKTNKTNIDNKIGQLKTLYQNLVKTNTKKIFLFCLDSFYFKYKTLVIELDNLSKFTSLIHNRMYGDYYKLYNIILTQFHDSGVEFPGSFSEYSKKYPAYKDLEPFHEYKMGDIINIHSDILNLINCHYMYYLGKEQNINTHTTSTRVGTSITSFIQTLEYENILVREQVSIYSNYLTFFHNSQREYLNKLLLKIQTFQKEIEEEIFMHYKPPALPTIEDSTVSTPENVIAENESPNIVITIDESTNLENMIKDAENNAENGGESNEETPTEETSLSE
jgi:hypothetical protein